MSLSRFSFSAIILPLTITVTFLGLHINYQTSAGRSHHIHATSAQTLVKTALENSAHPFMSLYPIVNEDNFFDTAAGMEFKSEKIDIPVLKKTNLKLKLWGTITGNGIRAYAIIEEGTKREQKIYQAGETIQNATIKMILRDKVILSFAGNDEVLEIETKQFDINAKNKYGVTTLIDASYRGQKEQVEWLIVEGADLNAQDNQGDTALMNAAIKGHSEIVKLLLENGADVHAKDNAGNTALIDAAKYARASTSEVLALLVEHGAEVNAENKFGETALMNAARWGHGENVAILIAEGADINAKTKSGETAVEFAAYSLHKDVVELLKSHGAKE
jgi:hypothetical protein